MEVIIWKLGTSKALGMRQRTVMLWQRRDRLASKVHFMSSFLQENPFFFWFEVATLGVLPSQSQHAPSWHPWLQVIWEGGGARAGVWVEKSSRHTDSPRAWRRQRVGTPNRPISPGLWVLSLPVQLAEQSQSTVPLAAWEQGMTDAWGQTFKWQTSWSLFCFYKRRSLKTWHLFLTFCIRRVPVHQCLCSCCVCLGWWWGKRFSTLLLLLVLVLNKISDGNLKKKI